MNAWNPRGLLRATRVLDEARAWAVKLGGSPLDVLSASADSEGTTVRFATHAWDLARRAREDAETRGFACRVYDLGTPVLDMCSQ